MTQTRTSPPTITAVPVPGVGPEDVLVRDDGTVYTGTDDGSVLAIRREGDQITRVGRTGGRPLGLEWLPDGRILVCDAHAGLLALETRSGAVETLVSDVEGRRMVFCNNAAVAPDGTIWFSDSSTVHPIDRWKHDLVEDTGTGRLMRRDPDGSVEVVLDGLRFANGVALSTSGDYVCVAETTGRTVVRHWLAGQRAGTTDHLATDLPGYPDNIALGSDGTIWVTLPSPKDRAVDVLHRAPMWARRAVLALPEAVQPEPKRTMGLMAFDEAGATVRHLTFEHDDFHMVTGVREHEGRVWMGSLVGSHVAWFDLLD